MDRLLKILICIDDTDNLESRGTGELAEIISKTVEEKGWGKCSSVTRHQLLVHPDIPYTSHNSSMCFQAEIEETYLEQVTKCICSCLEDESAEGSDPGLCLVIPDRLIDANLLMDFGRKAKQVILVKQEAYDLASRLEIHLSEHGGTGQGIIGALAGTGLRLSGNDGRFKGKLKLQPDSILSVKEVISQTEVQVVKKLNGGNLDEDERIRLGDHLKMVLLDGRATLLVYPLEDSTNSVNWQTCTKQQLKAF